MQITVNACKYSITPGTEIAQLRTRLKHDAAVTLVNGERCSDTMLLRPGDRVTFLGSSTGYTPALFDAMLRERHGEEVQHRLQHACVGLAGAGGLGSNIAIALARAGVGHLIVADHDVVELSNLHRQQYFIDQLEQPKVTALAQTLYRINSQMQVDTHQIRIEGSRTSAIFGAAQIMVEAFDDATAKADLVQNWLHHYPERPIIAASGMAGFNSVNDISTTNPFANLYVCGDGSSAVETSGSLCASRVAVAANHQAHAVICLLLGLNPAKATPTRGDNRNKNGQPSPAG